MILTLDFTIHLQTKWKGAVEGKQIEQIDGLNKWSRKPLHINFTERATVGKLFSRAENKRLNNNFTIKM